MTGSIGGSVVLSVNATGVYRTCLHTSGRSWEVIHYLILLVEEIQQNLSITPSDSGMYYCIVMN